MVPNREDVDSNSSVVLPTNQRMPLLQIMVLGFAWVMIYADRLSISPLVNIIKNEFGLSYLQVSIVLSIYFLTYVGFTIPAAIAARSWGFRKTMVVFFLLAAVSLGLAGILGFTYTLLVLFIGLHGVGAGAYYPTAYTISSTITPKKKLGFTSSLINSGMAFGSILGLVVAGFVLPFFSSWQVTLELLAIPTCVEVFLLWKFIPELKVTPDSKSDVDYLRVLRNKNFVLLAAAMYCSLYGYWVILTWGPGFLQSERGLGVLSSGAATAIFAAVSVVPSIIISRHSDKIGRKKISVLILPLAALSIFAMTYSASIFGFLAAIAGYGIVGKLTLDPIILAWVGDTMPKEILGPALALLNVAAMSSAILAPIITAAFADLTGSLAVGFYFGALIVLLGTVFVAFAKAPTSAGQSN